MPPSQSRLVIVTVIWFCWGWQEANNKHTTLLGSWAARGMTESCIRKAMQRLVYIARTPQRWSEAARVSGQSPSHSTTNSAVHHQCVCVYVHTYCSPHVFHQNTVICRRRGSTNNCVVVIDVSQSSNPSICQLQGWCDISSRRDVPMRTWRDDRSTNVHALIRALKLFGVWEFPIQMPEMR